METWGGIQEILGGKSQDKTWDPGGASKNGKMPPLYLEVKMGPILTSRA